MMHRVRHDPENGWMALRAVVQAKLGSAGRAPVRALLYRDDDGDQIRIDTDEALLEAAVQARRANGGARLAVTAICDDESTPRRTKESIAFGTFGASSAQVSSACAQPSAGTSAPVSSSGRVSPSVHANENMSAVTSFLGGLIAASSFAVGAGLVIAAKAARR